MRKISKELLKARIKETELEIELKKIYLKHKQRNDEMEAEMFVEFLHFKDVFRERFSEYMIMKKINKEEMIS